MKLYKYRYGSKRDLETLKNDYFYAPHSTQLNDPLENLFNEQDIYFELKRLESLLDLPTVEIKRRVEDLCQKVRTGVGIFSLSKLFNDELLWAYYADSHSGFCIEYDFEKLLKLREITASFEIAYAEKRPKLKFWNLVDNNKKALGDLLKIMTGTKSKRWAHEQEFRICIEPFGRFEYDYRAVTAIYFGLRMPPFSDEDLGKENKEIPENLMKVSQQQVMNALKGRGIKYYQMQLKPDSYGLAYQEVEDIYKNAKKYKDINHIIPINLIDYNDYGRGVERHYFDKVAKILSKEPYFYELFGINVSKEESILRNEAVISAIFYYEQNNPRLVKKYFTLEEIDQQYKLLNLP